MPKLLTLIAAIIPFQFAVSPLLGMDIALVRILIIIAALALMIRIATGKKFYMAHSTLPALLILFLIAALLSATVAYDATWFTRKFIFLINFFALFFIFTFSVGTYTTALRIMRAATLSGTFAALVALILWVAQFLIGADTVMTFWQRIIAPFFLGTTITDSVATYSSAYVNIAGTNYLRAVGLFPDPHVAAFFFELTLPFSVAFAIMARHRKARIFWHCASAITLLALLATFTRGAYVALFIGIGALLIGSLPFLTAHTLRRSITIFCIGILTIAILATTTPLGGRIASITGAQDHSVSERFTIWRDATDTIALHPLLGVGLGNYPFTQNVHATYRDPYYAHNLYLDIAVEMGIGTLILWLLIIAAALWHFLRRHRTPLRIAGILSIILYSTHSLFDTALFSVHTLPFLILILAFSTYKKH